MVIALSEQLAARVRAILRDSDHPIAARGSRVDWRTQRDRWVDELDPRQHRELSETEIRELIGFLAESGPSSESRMTPAEWHSVVDDLTPALLFTAR